MFKILLSLCFVAIAIASPLNKLNDDIKADILVVEDIEEFKRNNVGVELTPLKAEVTPFGIIRHTAGSRVGGDRLVASGNGGQSWATPQDVELSIQYPKSGSGAVVSYVEVVVDQSSNSGAGYIVGGGIGQRQIALVIQARSTLHFRYVAQIYGL